MAVAPAGFGAGRYACHGEVRSGKGDEGDSCDARTVLAELYKMHPEAKAKVKKAAGYAVFSNVGINVIFASFAGGHGVVVKSGMLSDT